MNDSSLRNPHWLNLVYLVEPKNLRSTGIFLPISFVVVRIMGKNLGVRQNGETWRAENRNGNKTEQERAEPTVGGGQTGGKSVRVGRWAKFLTMSSGKETCNFKLRTGPQLFSQDSFRV